MKLLVLGDTHGDLPFARHIIDIATQEHCDVIVQVGDWGYTWPGNQTILPKLNKFLAEYQMPMFWIDGNHDNYTDLQRRGFWGAQKFCVFEDAEFITYIPRGHVWVWDEVTFMALGGAYSIDVDGRIPGKSWWPEETISFADQVKCGVSFDLLDKPVDVFFSHDCPEGVIKLEEHLEETSPLIGILPGQKLDNMSRANRKALWQVVEYVKPQLLIHGHYHWAYTTHKEWDGHTMTVAGLACNGMKNSYTILDTKGLKP